MKIKYIDITELTEYSNNPRYNDESALYVAESIKSFGFKQPIVIDKKGVIVAGHTRCKAAKLLNYDKVPCLVADDLTEKEIQAYRLADNKVAEISKWDMGALNDELSKLNDIDMTMYGFKDLEGEIDELGPNADELIQDDDGYYGDERENTYNVYNLHEYDPLATGGFYQMPFIESEDIEVNELTGFNYVLSTKEKVDGVGVHFYLDDYQFERIWNRPSYYIDKIKESYDIALTPDFSLYMDMPMAMKVWNIYRARLIGQLMQRAGLRVIPTISWAEKETFEFCFDGIEEGATISVSTIGVKRDSDAYQIWVDGMDECIERLKPNRIIVYGGKLEDYKYKTELEWVFIDNKAFNRG